MRSSGVSVIRAIISCAHAKQDVRPSLSPTHTGADAPPLQAIEPRLERVLTADPGTGVMRHADAGYPDAIAVARERGVDLPMVTEHPSGRAANPPSGRAAERPGNVT